MSSESFPRKPKEEEKISVDIINNDQALAGEFNKIGNENEKILENFKTANDNKDNDLNKDKDKKSLFQSIGGAFSKLSDKLETNLEAIMNDPGKRALFYAGINQIDKASRITPISSGKAQSPFGQLGSSFGEAVQKVKGEELAAANAAAKASSSSTKNQLDMLKFQFEMDKPDVMELDAYKSLDKQMEDIASATKTSEISTAQKKLIKDWVINPENTSLPVGALRSKFPTFIQSINDLLPKGIRQENKFFDRIESDATFINNVNKLAIVNTLGKLTNTKLTPVSDKDVVLVKAADVQVTDPAAAFLKNLVFNDAVTLIDAEKVQYAKLFKQDRGFKRGSKRDFDKEFNSEGALRIRNKILKESPYSADQIYEEAKLLGFEEVYEKYTGNITDYSPFALASAKASLDMGGASVYSKFKNSPISQKKDENIVTDNRTTKDGDGWKKKYSNIDKKIQELNPNEEQTTKPGTESGIEKIGSSIDVKVSSEDYRAQPEKFKEGSGTYKKILIKKSPKSPAFNEYKFVFVE
jgi:hypothetical protein